MNTKKAKIRKGRFILALMIFTLSIFGKYDDCVHAEALPNFPDGVDLVSAADCIMSYMTSAGMFISNRDWIDELYTSFGGGAGFYINDLYQNGLLTLDEAGHYVSTGLDTALQNQSAWTSLHLDELFSVSAAEAAAGGGVAATGAGTIAGAIGGVATTGALPLAIGVTGAYWGGIGLGTLIAHAAGLYGEKTYYGLSVDALDSIVENISLGGGVGIRGIVNGYEFFYTYDSDTYAFLVPEFGYYVCNLYSKNSTFTYTEMDDHGGFSRKTGRNHAASCGYGNGVDGCYSSGWRAVTAEQYQAFKQDILNDIYVRPDRYSPDLIGSDGNATADVDENGTYTLPNLVPEVNPTGQSIVPSAATQEDWLRWANGANQNTTNGNPDSNADILQQILEAIRKNNPSPGVNPDPGTNPNPTPTPTPVPKPDYDPNQPNQPEYDPKETEGPSDVTNGSPWTTPDLLDKFPFCLPRDVLRCFEKLDAGSRIAPSISWHFTTPLGIPFNFDLDLDDYEGIASLLRTLELIAFIIGLAIVTRNLIGR